MRRERGGRIRAALVVWLAVAPQALPLTFLAAVSAPATGTCGCHDRVCCCPPKKDTRPVPCHGGATRRSVGGAPTWRCHHGLPSAALPGHPAVLAVPVSEGPAPPSAPARSAERIRVHDGHVRLDPRPPRVLHTTA